MNGRAVSSTAIREAVELGDLEGAAAHAGPAGRVLGTVVAGDRRGRTPGLPDRQPRPAPRAPSAARACTPAGRAFSGARARSRRASTRPSPTSACARRWPGKRLRSRTSRSTCSTSRATSTERNIEFALRGPPARRAALRVPRGAGGPDRRRTSRPPGPCSARGGPPALTRPGPSRDNPAPRELERALGAPLGPAGRSELGQVAQLVEHLTENQGVTSSSLVLPTIHPSRPRSAPSRRARRVSGVFR